MSKSHCALLLLLLLLSEPVALNNSVSQSSVLSAVARLAAVLIVVVVQSLAGAVVGMSEEELCHPTKFDFSIGRRSPNQSSLVPIAKTIRTESNTSRLASVVAESGRMSQ